MYAKQTTRSLALDCAFIALVTPLVMFALLMGVFSLDVGQGDAPRPMGFILLFTGLTALAGVFGAVSHWIAGPGMRKMSPAEEAAKKAQIRADVEARMQKADREAFGGMGVPAFLSDEVRAERYHTANVTR